MFPSEVTVPNKLHEGDPMISFSQGAMEDTIVDKFHDDLLSTANVPSIVRSPIFPCDFKTVDGVLEVNLEANDAVSKRDGFSGP